MEADEMAPDEEKELQVSFGIFDPRAQDESTIKAILNQGTPKYAAELWRVVPGLAHLTTIQSAVGSTIRVTDGEEKDQDVYGFATAISMAAHKDADFVKAAKALVLEKCPAAEKEDAERILSGGSFNVGWIVSERIVNIPHELARPLHRMLLDDVDWARKNPEECGHDEETFDFQYALLLCPSVQVSDDAGKGKKKKIAAFLRPEEEELVSLAEVTFSFKPEQTEQQEGAQQGNEDIHVALVPWEDYARRVSSWEI